MEGFFALSLIGGLYLEGLIFGIFTVFTFTERMSL